MLVLILVTVLAFSLCLGSLLCLFFKLRLGLNRFKVDRNGHERAILIEDIAQLELAQILAAILADVHDNVGASALALALAHLIVSRLGADPSDGGSAGVRAGNELYAVADHEGGIEAQTEMSDDSGRTALGVFILGDKIHSTRQSYLTDKFFYLLAVHADTVIRDGNRARVAVKANIYAKLAVVKIAYLAERGKTAQLSNRIACV